MATAEISSQVIALPRRETGAPSWVDSPGIATWLPLVSILVGIVSLFYLTQTSELTTTGYSIQQLQEEENRWKLRNEQLALDLAGARSLARVEAQATGRLLMVHPKELVYLRVPSEQLAYRSSPSSRGETSAALALEKARVRSGGGLLDSMRDALSAVLVPDLLKPPQLQ